MRLHVFVCMCEWGTLLCSVHPTHTTSQAENNSCYLDSTLFALFAHMQSADFLLDAARPGLSPSAQRLRELLWTTVVGPLRKRAFVSRDAMEAVRITLNEWLPGTPTCTNEPRTRAHTININIRIHRKQQLRTQALMCRRE